MIFKKVKEIISKKGIVHFRRYQVFASKRFSIYIHYFTHADKELHEHDHPWNFSSLVLKGGYIEQYSKKYRSRGFLSFKRFKANHSHRIAQLNNNKPCWTLVFVGKRKREWGYVTEKGWVDHKTYREMKHKL